VPSLSLESGPVNLVDIVPSLWPSSMPDDDAMDVLDRESSGDVRFICKN
jgi:hypothetical protein